MTFTYQIPLTKRHLLACLPLGAILNALVFADDNSKSGSSQDLELPVVEVRDARIDSGNYFTGNARAGTKTDSPLLETPESISVITGDEMDAQNVSILAEARYTPGVQSESFGFEPRTTFLKMRGFDATETGLFNDGLKLVNPRFSVSYSLEPYGAERKAS